MPVCHNCGSKLVTGEKLCTRCGTVVQKNAELLQKSSDKPFNQQTLTDTSENESFINTRSMKDIPKSKNYRTIIIIAAAIIVLITSVGIATNGAAPLRAKYNTMLGSKYLNGRKYEEAILAFQKVIQIEPRNVEARVELAKLYIKIAKPDEAEKILKEAISINPKKVESYLELANLYIYENNPGNAIKVLADGYRVTNSGSIGSMLENLESKIITNNIEKTIVLGENYSLPKEVAVKINNIEVQFPIKWDISSADLTKVGVNEATGTLENTDKVIKLTINVIGIASVENINNTINQNDKYSLPLKVTAKMTDGSSREVEITWNPPTMDTSKAGSYSYEGTVIGYSNKIKLTLNIIGIASIENISSTIKQNDKYILPSKVTAKMTDGSTRKVEVTWTPSTVDTSKAGSYTYQGTVSGYNNRVKLTINIKAKQNDDDYTPEMAIKLAKEYDGVADNDDIVGEVWGPFYENGKKYYTVRLYSISTSKSGSSQSFDVITIAKDGSTTFLSY